MLSLHRLAPISKKACFYDDERNSRPSAAYKFKGDTEPNLSNVGGVIAQIKWGTIGTLGEQGMKDVILELTKKLEGRKEPEDKSFDMPENEYLFVEEE